MRGKKRRDRATALCEAAEARRQAGDLAAALDCYAEAGELYRQLGDVEGRLRALTGTAQVHRSAQRFADAAATYRDAVELSDSLDWAAVTRLLHLKVAAMDAAETAGIDVPDELIEAAATAGPGRMWVYDVDRELVPPDSPQVPARAIRCGWEVADGRLTGLMIPNVDYGAG